MLNLKLLIKIAGWFTLMTAVIFLGAALFVYQHTQKFVVSASHTNGKVAALIQRNGEKEFFPVFSFKDASGKEYRIESLSGSYPASYSVGDPVAVIYQPDQPENAKIDTFLDIWIWPIALAGCGLLDLLFALGMMTLCFVLGLPQRETVAAHPG